MRSSERRKVGWKSRDCTRKPYDRLPPLPTVATGTGRPLALALPHSSAARARAHSRLQLENAIAAGGAGSSPLQGGSKQRRGSGLTPAAGGCGGCSLRTPAARLCPRAAHPSQHCR